MATRAKRFLYAATLQRDGRIAAEGAGSVTLPASWTPEHLLLVAVARCTLKSLDYHARRLEAAVSGSADASCTVTQRDEDGRYAVVELAVEFAVELEPEPYAQALGELLFRAERDCFVGNSLRVKPLYTWTVNGRAARSTPQA